jgi:hypothetical protein
VNPLCENASWRQYRKTSSDAETSAGTDSAEVKGNKACVDTYRIDGTSQKTMYRSAGVW